jgi:hypothetical protein
LTAILRFVFRIQGIIFWLIVPAVSAPEKMAGISEHSALGVIEDFLFDKLDGIIVRSGGLT